MNILSHFTGNTKKIIIFGELKNTEDQTQFFIEVGDPLPKEVILTFMNTRILDEECLLRLMDTIRENLTIKYKIIAFHSYLYSYLLRLNIQNVYYENPNILKKINSLSDKVEEYYFDNEQYIDFLQNIYEQYGFDYKNYKSESLKRRICTAMMKLNMKSFKTFSHQILSDADLFEELFIEMSINVTEFFRDESTFSFIREKILPYLNSYLHIKIWCAGCSTGEEPYSMAILLEEMGMLKKCQIYATDINPYVVEEAKNGLFHKSKFIKGKENYKKIEGSKPLEEYFEKKDDIYIVNKGLKDKILFFQHSLLENGIINEFQLILCRNVLIYFNYELQEKVLLLLSNSLDRNGFLVLGKSEGILSNKAEKEFSTLDKLNKIYKKIIKNHELGD